MLRAAYEALVNTPVNLLQTHRMLNGESFLTWLTERNGHKLYTPFIKDIQTRIRDSNKYTGYGLYGEELALATAIEEYLANKITIQEVYEALLLTDPEALDIALLAKGKVPLLTKLIKTNKNGIFNGLIEQIIDKAITSPHPLSALNHADFFTAGTTPLAVARECNLDPRLIRKMKAKGALEQRPPAFIPTTPEDLDAFVNMVRARGENPTAKPPVEQTPEQPRSSLRAKRPGEDHNEQQTKRRRLDPNRELQPLV